ncbi:hypothetical protein ACWCQN_48105 [Streptomyces sp. NPDC001984]
MRERRLQRPRPLSAKLRHTRSHQGGRGIRQGQRRDAGARVYIEVLLADGGATGTVRVVPELPDPDEGLVRRAVHRWRFESVALEAPG